MRIVFMGTPAFAVPSLKALLHSEHQVVGIVTQPDRPKGRGKQMVASPIKALAQENNLPILQPEKIKSPEFFDELTQWAPDAIVVVAFGRILPKTILTLPHRGCLNVHASLLPHYRGASPIQWAIINGETETGITTMLMDEGMDTGDLLLQETEPILPTDTATSLSNRLATRGGTLLLTTLRAWETGTLLSHPQAHENATMAPILQKADGTIDWALDAQSLVNRIRGLSPWPGSFTFLEGHRLTIWQASVCGTPQSETHEVFHPGTIVFVDTQRLEVATGSGLITLTEVQPANGKRMPIEHFLTGHHINAGMIFQPEPVSSPQLNNPPVL
ncbi:MAG: methionyl-tRNA formyltransferase [Nitrospirales bacterium]|nr:methionyl-tRNA formyltransferase [Nitrospirales bacterium]